MVMKSILVAAEEPVSLPPIFSTALLVAQQFGSHIEGMDIRSSAIPIVAADGMSALTSQTLESIAAEEIARAERMREQFQTLVQARGVFWGEPSRDADGPSADWLEVEPYEAESVGERGRLFDLIVVGRPLAHASTTLSKRIIESALFDTGRPVLIAPPSAPTELGRVIVIAWNGSPESARAITFAMPFLERAERVFVVEVEGATVPGPSIDEVKGYLARNGIAIETKRIEPGDKSAGQVLLDETASLGADLLVKGAYTHSRLRQMIFGGVTSHILTEAKLPVLMAH